MMKFVCNPNLPLNKVKTVICGVLCDELNCYLDSCSIERIVIEANEHIGYAVKYHADMAAIHLGEEKILLDSNQQKLGCILKEKGFSVHFTAKQVKGEYPNDIALNFAVFGKNFLGKVACADESLMKLTQSYNRICVKQGYAKCSCLVVSDNAIITDDESIYNALVNNGVDALLISKGDVHLEGHDYGFIGGASCKISADEVLFFGDITKHRDYKIIADFIEKYGCKIISLDFPLSDFGGIIPIIEEV